MFVHWMQLTTQCVPCNLAGKYNFSADQPDFEGVIDAAIADELGNNTSTSIKMWCTENEI